MDNPTSSPASSNPHPDDPRPDTHDARTIPDPPPAAASDPWPAARPPPPPDAPSQPPSTLPTAPTAMPLPVVKTESALASPWPQLPPPPTSTSMSSLFDHAIHPTPNAQPTTPGIPATPPVPTSPTSANASLYRPLNVKDALSYLEMVKVRFSDRPDVYNHFLDIMKDFKSQTIDTPGVIERVSTLFTGHPMLIQGFNTFLPQGYRIECSLDGHDTNLITVTTPTGTTTSTTSLIGNPSRSIFTASTAAAHVPSFPPSTVAAPPPLGSPGPSAAAFPGPSNTPIPYPSTSSPAAVPIAPLNVASYPLSPSLHASTGAALLGGLVKGSPAGPEFNHAIQYVNKIKNRFSGEPETYKQFLEILQTYQKEQRPIQDVYAQVTILFKNSTDLLDEFKQFLPDPNGNVPVSSGLFNMIGHMTATGPIPFGLDHLDKSDKGKERERERDRESEKEKDKDKKKLGEKAPAPQRRKKRALDKEASAAPKPGQSKAKRTKHHHKGDPPSPSYPNAPGSPSTSHHPSQSFINGNASGSTSNPHGSADETAFFDRVKKYIDDRTTYNEFLKLLNLFVQEIIDIRDLVKNASGYIGEGELLTQFKEILGWEDNGAVELDGGARGVPGLVSALDRPKIDLNSLKQYGPSYRKLPKDEIALACSGRDAMCWEVLNDEWVAHPSWASEEAGFNSHRKNAYEEALHKSEEERHEYDFHIEAITRTIQVLEPISARINLMDTEERASFKLKPGLGGQGKSIYQRIIKKVYGRDHGLEVIQALHDSPAIAVPVVLARLKQKDEEWKRAQREWNKVWREVDARNYYKSLDHQGINFKANDKKTVNGKALVQEIENTRNAQAAERGKLIDPTFGRTLPKYQFAYRIEDQMVLQDCVKLVLLFLDRVGQQQISRSDKESVESFLRSFVPIFFMLDAQEFDAPFCAPPVAAPPIAHPNPSESGDEMSDDVTSVMDEGDDAGSVAGSASGSRRKRNGGVAAGDLRKKLLKSTQAGKGANGSAKKSGAGGRASPAASPSRRSSPARRSPAPSISAQDQMQIDAERLMSPGPALGSGIPSDGHGDGIGSGAGQMWVRCDPTIEPGAEKDAERRAADGPTESRRSRPSRKGVFFCNSSFYVLLRLLQTLYSRLETIRNAAIKFSDIPPTAHLVNPVARELGLHDSIGALASRLLNEGPNMAHRFYPFALDCCERLFDGEMEQAQFEDLMRYMFGTSAYLMFTVDKVVGAIVKQIQIVMSDPRCQELFTLLRRERELDLSNGATSHTPVQLQINYRRQAEGIIGAGELLYRVNWIDGSKVIQLQLLSKEDASVDDAQNRTDRWKQYIESYVLSHQTEGIVGEVKAPMLRRCIDVDEDVPLPSSKFVARGGIQIKVCIRTYRLFFVPQTEDFFWRNRKPEEVERTHERAVVRRADRRISFEKWLDARVRALGHDDSTPKTSNMSVVNGMV